MENSTSEGNPVTDEPTTIDTEAPEVEETPAEDDLQATTDEPAGEPDTFSREYVEKLRHENGKYRQRAQRADDLAHRLHRALVAADGRLHDPTDLEFAADHLDDEEALIAAVDDLLDRKPHLAARKVTGDVGQGATPAAGSVDLLGILGGHR